MYEKNKKNKCLIGPGWERGKKPRTTSMCTCTAALVVSDSLWPYGLEGGLVSKWILENLSKAHEKKNSGKEFHVWPH